MGAQMRLTGGTAQVGGRARPAGAAHDSVRRVEIPLTDLKWKLDIAHPERASSRYGRGNRLSVLLPMLDESIQDPIEGYCPGAGDCQDEHSARYGEILFEM